MVISKIKANMAPKTWTYLELTTTAELQIERCARQAAVLVAGGDRAFAQRYAEWAYGVYELWREHVVTKPMRTWNV